MADPPTYPGAPRWLKRSAIAAGGVALLLVILLHGSSGLHHHMAPIGSPTHNAAQETAH
jgi:hypothetical protein